MRKSVKLIPYTIPCLNLVSFLNRDFISFIMVGKKKGFSKSTFGSKKSSTSKNSDTKGLKEDGFKENNFKEKEVTRQSVSSSANRNLVSPEEITGNEPNNLDIAKLNTQKPKSLLATNALVSKRVLAFIIDILIISLIVLPAYLPVARDYEGLSFEEISQKVETDEYLLMIPFYAGFIAFFYFVLLELSFGQTFGKKALGVYVVSLDGKMSASKAIMRSLLLLDIPFFGIIRMFDFAYALFNPNNQRLLEQFSKTKSIQFYALNS